MTIKELRNWLFENSVEDQWWISVDGLTEEGLKSLSEIRDCRNANQHSEIKILHNSQAQLQNPPWIEVDSLVPNAPVTSARQVPPQGTVQKNESHTGLIICGYIFGFIIPIVGFILGIILLAKSVFGHGAAVMVVSIVTALIWFVVNAQ